MFGPLALCKQANPSQLLKCARTQVTETEGCPRKAQVPSGLQSFYKWQDISHTHTLGLILQPVLNVHFSGYAGYQKKMASILKYLICFWEYFFGAILPIRTRPPSPLPVIFNLANGINRQGAITCGAKMGSIYCIVNQKITG